MDAGRVSVPRRGNPRSTQEAEKRHELFRAHQPGWASKVSGRSWLHRRARSTRQAHANRERALGRLGPRRTRGVDAMDRVPADPWPVGHHRSGIQAGLMHEVPRLGMTRRVLAYLGVIRR
jgi:hypothetical protein